MFVVFEREENRQKKMITEICKFWVFGPKMAVLWRTTAFQKKRPWSPYFYSVFGVRAFWAKVSKKGNSEKPPKKRKNLTDNWKAIFWCFCCFFVGGFFFSFFLFFCLVFFCFFFLVFFVGGFKGQVRWPKGPPHLALNPPYFFFFCFLFFVLFFFCFFWRV